MYAKDTSKKINSVLQSKRNNGEYLGTVPYGYEKDPENKYHLVIDEEAAEVVRTVFRMFLEGYGTMQIADYLSEQKIPIPSDYNKRNRGTKSISYGLWPQSTVRFILSNEVYTGTVVQGKRKKISFKSKKFVDVPEEDWIRVPNMHEAIVSKEDFERAKKILEATKGSRIVENDYLFKGLLQCFDCKGYIGIRSPDKNGNIYGRCQHYARYSKFDVCSPHNFNYQVFEESMIVVLREICKEYSDKKKLEEIAKKSKSKEDKESDLRNKLTYIFEKNENGMWNLLYKWSCTVGKPSTPTITGTFYINGRKPYFGSDIYRVKYATRIKGSYYYHSILFNPQGTEIINDTLGVAISHGCIRLAVENAQWIYDNILDTTTVVIN